MDEFPRWRRRQTLVNKQYQFRFTASLLVQMTTVIVAIGAFAYVESQRTMDLVLRYVADFPLSSHELHLNDQTFLLKTALVVAITAIVQVIFGIYTSHKLAGPVLKMTQVLEQASEGDYTARIRFRDGDHLEDLATTMNRMLQTLEGEQLAMQQAIEEIEADVHRLRSSGSASLDDLLAVREKIARFAGATIEVPEACAR